MSGHKVVYANSSDSNLLHTFDMTDGRYQAVEFNHTEALDDIYPDARDNSVVMEFDSDGSAVLKNLGDGQSSVVVTPRVDNSANFRPFTGGEMVLKISSDTQIRYQANQNGDIDYAQPVRVEKISDNSLICDYTVSSPQVAGQIGSLNINVSASFSSDWSSDTRTSIYYPNFLFYQGHMWFVARSGSPWDGVPYTSYLCKALIDPATSQGTIVQSWAVGGEGWSNYVDTYVGDEIYVLPNGHFAFNAWGNKWLDFDTQTGVLVQNDFDNFQPVTMMNRALRSNKDVYVVMPSFNLDALINTGLSATVLHADLSVETKAFPAQPNLFPFPIEQYDYDGRSDDAGKNRYVAMIDNVKNANTGEWTTPRKMIMLDFETGEMLVQDFKTDLENTLTCKFGELYIRDLICKDNVQPYKVEGVIAADGANSATELFLMDNVSMMICGRTKSDPTTGAYKFRCWNSGKKSVFAKHPVSGGLRMAAEVIPTADN